MYLTPALSAADTTFLPTVTSLISSPLDGIAGRKNMPSHPSSAWKMLSSSNRFPQKTSAPSSFRSGSLGSLSSAKAFTSNPFAISSFVTGSPCVPVGPVTRIFIVFSSCILRKLFAIYMLFRESDYGKYTHKLLLVCIFTLLLLLTSPLAAVIICLSKHTHTM